MRRRHDWATMMTRPFAGALTGVVGPAVFTGAWVISSLRQTGYAPADIQLSGLAAPDARDPWIMLTGFAALGGSAVLFGRTLRTALGGRESAGPGPALIQGAGVLTIAAGLMRRDHMLLTAGPVSWHNHAHDVISALIYADLVLAQLALARTFGRDVPSRAWRQCQSWRPWMLASGLASAAALIVFATDTSAPEAGVTQRVAVSIPLAALAAMATRLATQTQTHAQPQSQAQAHAQTQP
ncbi:MAG TPA: DUF998 domain-containing protein [Streptosporangiaceae bacterium]